MKKSLLLAAASLAVIACSKRTIGEAPVDPNLPADNVVRFSSAASTATVSKAGLDASGHSTFEVDDTIGIYAVLDTKTLGAAPASVFPTNADFQYLNRKYVVKSVDPYDGTTNPATPVPAIAHFEPFVDPTATPDPIDNTMYYLAGGQGWNYYAYYPTTLPGNLADASGNVFEMPTTVASATNTNFVGTGDMTNSTIKFFDQTGTPGTVTKNAYPGPIMFAYYGKKDTQAALGTRQDPVRLQFKYAVAKLTLEVTVAHTVTRDIPKELKAIAMYGDGMNQGFKFDLTQAKQVDATSGVYNVVTTDATAPAMANWTNTTTFPTFSGSSPFTGYLFKIPSAASDTTTTTITIPAGTGGTPAATTKPAAKFTVTGYLIPAGNNATSSVGGDLTNVFIKFYVSGQTNGKDPEVYTATLDQTKGGLVTTLPGTSTAAKNYLPAIAPGKEYKFKLTLDKNEIEFEGEIQDWEVVEPNGSDEIPAV